ncbi:MAG TPA: UXX-star (seleno)protein family 1 [Anaeromyxobacter sp.]|nr:UXX-star (seleno)protein family 1 [Anaeromyxobacter sp.]
MAVEIYGKDDCPYTNAARRAYESKGVEVRYHDVTEDAEAMRRFLALGHGSRRVPLIVEGERVTQGFGGS